MAKPRRDCIYCRATKPASDFNREHVVPTSFGTFEQNLVLDCVCRGCNSFFSRELELKLGRDTYEGIERFRRGVRSPRDYQTLGRRSTFEVRVTEGAFAGAIVEFISGPSGLLLRPVPQVGFAKSRELEHLFFRIGDLPTRDRLVAMGFITGAASSVRAWCCDQTALADALDSRGIAFAMQGEPELIETREGDRLSIEQICRIDSVVMRAMAKLSFNYVAATSGADVVLMPEFDEVRRYVRTGERGQTAIVTVGTDPILGNEPDGHRHLGHILTVRRDDPGVVGQVSLFNRFAYRVRLAKTGATTDGLVDSGHFFDVENRVLHTLSRDPQ